MKIRIPARAVLTLSDADLMTKREAAEIAQWLRRNASFVLRNHKKLTRRFRARLMR